MWDHGVGQCGQVLRRNTWICGAENLRDNENTRMNFRRWLVRFPRAVPVAIFLSSLTLTGISVLAIERMEAQKENARMDQKAQALASAIERRANASSSYLRAGSALFATLDLVSGPVFHHFVSELRLDVETRGAEGIGWAPRVLRKDIPAYNRRLMAEYDASTQMYPALAANQPYAVPVTYLNPQSERSRRAIGFDMFSEGVRRAAMLKAEDAARPIASGKVVLKQEGQTPAAGFLIYMPVFRQTQAGPELKGFIYSPFNAQDFLNSSLQIEDADDLGITLYDGRPGPANFLAGIRAGEMQGPSVIREVVVADHVWVLVLKSPRDLALSSLSLASLVFGMLVATLLMIVVRLITQAALEDQQAIIRLEEQNSIRNSLTRELNHRVKNTLANVLSLVALTRRRANDLDTFAEGLTGRIRALSATHDLLTESNWGTTPISAVIGAELAPFVQEHSHLIDVSGPTVELAPNDALSLGLAIHELATNAAKYGALSAADGKVSVDWQLLDDGRVQVNWRESDGPPIIGEPGRGFGTDLIEKVVAHELGNPVDLRFEPDGVRCSIVIPVRIRTEFSMRERK